MGTRITISLPERTAQHVRERAKITGRPISQLIVEDLEAQETQRMQKKLIEDYKTAAMDEETQRVTAELEALDAEDWPKD